MVLSVFGHHITYSQRKFHAQPLAQGKHIAVGQSAGYEEFALNAVSGTCHELIESCAHIETAEVTTEILFGGKPVTKLRTDGGKSVILMLAAVAPPGVLPIKVKGQTAFKVKFGFGVNQQGSRIEQIGLKGKTRRNR